MLKKKKTCQLLSKKMGVKKNDYFYLYIYVLYNFRELISLKNYVTKWMKIPNGRLLTICHLMT